MPECKRIKVREDLDAVSYTRELESDTREPGWYLEHGNRVSAGGPYSSQKEAEFFAKTVSAGPVIIGGDHGLGN